MVISCGANHFGLAETNTRLKPAATMDKTTKQNRLPVDNTRCDWRVNPALLATFLQCNYASENAVK